MAKSTPAVIVSRSHDWATLIKAQQALIRTGDYQRIGTIDVMCFELTAISNPRMRILAEEKNARGGPAWPGIHFDWLNQGPTIAICRGHVIGGSPDLLLPRTPFPLPPDAPDPKWQYSEAQPEPPRIPQRLEDRAMKIKGTPFLIIQPVIQLHWRLDLVMPGHSRREVHQIAPDSSGIHMAFIYDTESQTAHLVGGSVL